MTVSQLANKLNLEIACGNENLSREITDVYCCDLLSLVMGRAPADCAWLTVMGNVNSVAVAVLADVSCIILCEAIQPDDDALKKAQGQDVCILKSPLPIYRLAMAISEVTY